MKFSIILTHYNRRDLLINTLNSIKLSSLIHETELIIIDDASDDIHNIDNIKYMYPDLDIKLFKFTKTEKWWTCPVITINKGIAETTGDIVIIQGAEIFHNGDILLDISRRIKPNDYLVYATWALSENNSKVLSMGMIKDGKGSWYQHSIYNNRCLNFCVALYRNELLDIGGFDERYAYGTWFGDDDFILRIRRKGMNVVSIDDPYTLHQFHPLCEYKPEINPQHMHDYDLIKHVYENETGYKVKNSFLK